MWVVCDTCHRSYNDEASWTICPHGPLEFPLESYCRSCDTVKEVHGECRHQKDKRLEVLEKRVVELEGVIAELHDLFKACDEQRLQETYASQAKAKKWELEGDMYGWNFHQGVASGTTQASIIFHRVFRKIEEIKNGIKPAST